MSLTKSHVIDSIYNTCGFSKTGSADHLKSVLELIKRSLESGEDVMISGFGKFCVKDKNSKRGRNPATGEDLMLDARSPDPPSKYHLRRCLRSFVPAAYVKYASVLTPRRLASDILLMSRDTPKSLIHNAYVKI